MYHVHQRKTAFRFVLDRKPDEVIRELEKEGWPQLYKNEGGTRALFAMDRRVLSRVNRLIEN